jgi:prevent-host-death family protein
MPKYSYAGNTYERISGRCLAVLDRVQKTQKSVVITKQGRPVAKLVPVKESQAEGFLGRLEGIVKVVGDIEATIWTSPI